MITLRRTITMQEAAQQQAGNVIPLNQEEREDLFPEEEGEIGGHLTVVPANAGTHTPRPFNNRRCGLAVPATIDACGYESRLALRLAGTTPTRAPHTLRIVTETFGPFRMVW